MYLFFFDHLLRQPQQNNSTSHCYISEKRCCLLLNRRVQLVMLDLCLMFKLVTFSHIGVSSSTTALLRMHFYHRFCVLRSSGSRPSSEINQVVCVRILLGIFCRSSRQSVMLKWGLEMPTKKCYYLRKPYTGIIKMMKAWG